MADDNDIDLEETMVTVDEFDTEEEARRAGAELVVHGIGAEIAPIEEPEGGTAAGIGDAAPADADIAEIPGPDAPPPPPPPPPPPSGPLVTVGYRVMVLRHELRRAEEVLGLVEPEERPLANPDEPMKPLPRKGEWKIVLAIFIVALVTIPALAFWATYFIVGR